MNNIKFHTIGRPTAIDKAVDAAVDCYAKPFRRAIILFGQRNHYEIEFLQTTHPTAVKLPNSTTKLHSSAVYLVCIIFAIASMISRSFVAERILESV